MPATISRLRPYKSFILARIRDGIPEGPIISSILDDIDELLGLNTDGPRNLIARSRLARVGDLSMAFLHYVEEQQAPWTSDPEIVDRVNHLVLASRFNRQVAICMTDPRWRNALTDRFTGSGNRGLGALQRVAPGILNAAFVKGRARTLWLSGTHRRISIKADSKILSGIDLRDALDPLGDQTYYFTAARCLTGAEEIDFPVGVSPRGSRIWVGATKGWDEFTDTLATLLKHLDHVTEPVGAPLPVVAVSGVDAGKIENAFDIVIAPPPELIEEIEDQDIRKEMELWAYQSTLNVIDTHGANLTAEVWLAGKNLGNISLSMKLSDLEHMSWDVDGKAASEEEEEDFEKALEAAKKRHWVKIWYESGHTLSDGAIYEVRHRDMPFRNFTWVDFSGFDVTKEKPAPLTAIGKQDSLFCWTQRFWPNLDRSHAKPGGWLACDDGSMEIADFIHLDIEAERPVLSLIHVKGAASGEKDRAVSVSKYEVVTGQAVKNLRHLDLLILQEGLSKGLGKKISKLVWHDGKPTSRENMIAAIEKIGADFERTVVVLQPHLTKRRHDQARKDPKSPDAARLRQLDTLLLSAEASTHALGARFAVTAAQ